MTDRPEGIEQRDWDDACSAMDRAGWFMRSVRVECAKAIFQARSQAYEEQSKITNEMIIAVVHRAEDFGIALKDWQANALVCAAYYVPTPDGYDYLNSSQPQKG